MTPRTALAAAPLPAPGPALRRTLAAGLAAVALLASAAGAQGTPRTFESMPSGPALGDFVPVANCAMDEGLMVTAVGEPCGLPAPDVPSAFVAYAPSNASYTGSVALVNNLGTPVAFTGAGGARFSLFSIDLAPVVFNFGGPMGTLDVTFTGLNVGGTTVSQTFALSLDGMLQSFAFGADFRDLQSARFEAGAPDFAVQFDNVNASVVPEPSTYLLVASGLAGLTLVTRRRRAPR